MSVISTVVAVPNRLEVLWSILRDAGAKGIERDELQRMIVPKSLGSADEEEKGEKINVFKGSLKELISSGFAEIIDKKIVLTIVEPDSFLGCVERLLLSPNINVDSKQGYLAGSIAWFLTREPTKPLPWRTAPHNALRADFCETPRTFEITNDSGWQNFAYWARFLGYATVIEIGGQSMVVPDPKIALNRHLDTALPAGQEMPVGAFLRNLASLTPVFENGAAHRAVEERLKQNRRLSPHQLSPATSLALRRLQIAGDLRLIRHDDAEIWIAHGLHDGRVSHLKRG